MTEDELSPVWSCCGPLCYVYFVLLPRNSEHDEDKPETPLRSERIKTWQVLHLVKKKKLTKQNAAQKKHWNVPVIFDRHPEPSKRTIQTLKPRKHPIKPPLQTNDSYTNQPTNLPTNQPTYQPTYQPTNQPTSFTSSLSFRPRTFSRCEAQTKDKLVSPGSPCSTRRTLLMAEVQLL